jgi:methyltransferase OMS1
MDKRQLLIAVVGGGVTLFAGVAAGNTIKTRQREKERGLGGAAVWDDPGTAAKYDDLVSRDERMLSITKERTRLCSQATGHVLEVGAGTGRNLDGYAAAPVPPASLTLCDASPAMLSAAARKLAPFPPPISTAKLVKADTSELPFDSAAFQTVVETFGLCSTSRPSLALDEMVRVLSPGGTLLLLEHGESKNSIVNYFLEAGRERHETRYGCDWKKDVRGLVDDAINRHGLRVEQGGDRHFGTTVWYVLKKPEVKGE